MHYRSKDRIGWNIKVAAFFISLNSLYHIDLVFPLYRRHIYHATEYLEMQDRHVHIVRSYYAFRDAFYIYRSPKGLEVEIYIKATVLSYLFA